MADDGHMTFAQSIGGLFSTAWERITAFIAAGAILLPVWHPTLKDISEAASLVAPILGCLSLTVQIGAKIWQITRARSPSS